MSVNKFFQHADFIVRFDPVYAQSYISCRYCVLYVREEGGVRGEEGSCLFAGVLDSRFATVPGSQYRVITVYL